MNLIKFATHQVPVDELGLVVNIDRVTQALCQETVARR